MKKITIVLAMIVLVIECAHPPKSIRIQEKVSEHDDVDTFVTWLQEQPNLGMLMLIKNHARINRMETLPAVTEINL